MVTFRLSGKIKNGTSGLGSGRMSIKPGAIFIALSILLLRTGKRKQFKFDNILKLFIMRTKFLKNLIDQYFLTEYLQ